MINQDFRTTLQETSDGCADMLSDAIFEGKSSDENLNTSFGGLSEDVVNIDKPYNEPTPPKVDNVIDVTVGNDSSVEELSEDCDLNMDIYSTPTSNNDGTNNVIVSQSTGGIEPVFEDCESPFVKSYGVDEKQKENSFPPNDPTLKPVQGTNADKIKDFQDNVSGTLNEGVIGDFIGGIKGKISNYLKEKQLEREKRIKVKKEKTSKKVLKLDLIKEREDFKKFFYKTLHKYPELIKYFKKEDESYQEQFSPYEYDIVYGYIYGDAPNTTYDNTFSERLEKIGAEFDDEIETMSHSLKYHEVNIELFTYFDNHIQHGYYMYELYDNTGDSIIAVDKLDEPSEVMHESSNVTVYELRQKE